ncbi:MAG: hypothetical protein ACE14V_11775 [bacterium]
MKRTIIIVLVLVVVSVAFYWGYKNAMVPKQQFALINQQNRITKPPPQSHPTPIPENAITRETTFVVTLNTPVTIFNNDGLNRKCELMIKPMPSRNNANAANRKQFLVNLQVTTPLPNIRAFNPKVMVVDNLGFTIYAGNNPSANADTGANMVLDGRIKSISDTQVDASLKLSSW